MICDECQALYEEVGDLARQSDVFAKVRRTDDALKCTAREIDSEAWYTVEVELPDHKRVWVTLKTPDRWLSESIEAELMHVGDKIEELLEEELVDQGVDRKLPVEHFRDDEKMYVFRSPIDLPADQELDGEQMIELTSRVLLAYEACFRQLGDMAPASDIL